MVTPRSGFDLEYYLNRAGGEKTGGRVLPERRAAGRAAGPVVRQGRRSARASLTARQWSGSRIWRCISRPTRGRGTSWGGRRTATARFRQILARKLAAEPHATWERRLELEREAAQETRRSPVYTDLTVAHNKSMSVLHASFREQARRARLAGDAEREALWRAREERVQEILQEANHAALEHLQEHAGFTRTGYHGRKVDGVEPGRWARAGWWSRPGCRGPTATANRTTTPTT